MREELRFRIRETEELPGVFDLRGWLAVDDPALGVGQRPFGEANLMARHPRPREVREAVHHQQTGAPGDLVQSDLTELLDAISRRRRHRRDPQESELVLQALIEAERRK